MSEPAILGHPSANLSVVTHGQWTGEADLHLMMDPKQVDHTNKTRFSNLNEYTDLLVIADQV